MADDNNNGLKTAQDQPKTGQQAGQQQKQGAQQDDTTEPEPAVDNVTNDQSGSKDKSR